MPYSFQCRWENGQTSLISQTAIWKSWTYATKRASAKTRKCWKGGRVQNEPICFYDPIVGTKKHFAVAKMQFKIRRHVYGRVYGSPHPETRSKADKIDKIRKTSFWISMKIFFERRQCQLTTFNIYHTCDQSWQNMFEFVWVWLKEVDTGWTKGSHPCENLPFGELLPASSTAGAGQSDFHPMQLQIKQMKMKKDWVSQSEQTLPQSILTMFLVRSATYKT